MTALLHLAARSAWNRRFVLALVVLSIFLRQDKSPQSKPLQAPHSQTGT